MHKVSKIIGGGEQVWFRFYVYDPIMVRTIGSIRKCLRLSKRGVPEYNAEIKHYSSHENKVDKNKILWGIKMQVEHD